LSGAVLVTFGPYAFLSLIPLYMGCFPAVGRGLDVTAELWPVVVDAPAVALLVLLRDSFSVGSQWFLTGIPLVVEKSGSLGG
jgi:hypothetical protein